MTQNDVSPHYPARTAWIQKIKAASEAFIEMEKKKREKAYQCKFDLFGTLNMSTRLIHTNPMVWGQ